MADNTEIQKILADLIKSQQNSMFSRNAEDRNAQEIIKKLDDMEKGSAAKSKEELKIFQKALEKNNISKDIKELGDKLEFQDQTKAIKSIVAQVKSINAQKFTDKQEFDSAFSHMTKTAIDAGLTLEELGIKANKDWDNAAKKATHIIDNHNKVETELTEELIRRTAAEEEARIEIERHSVQYGIAQRKLGMFGDIVKTITKDFWRLAEAEQRFAQSTATADAGWIEGMVELGVSQLEYMKVLKDTRVQNLAMSSAGIDFKESLKAGQQTMLGFTANSEEALKASADFHKNMSAIGVSQANLGDAVNEQSNIYKDNYRALGYTAEQFNQLSAELINEQGMRSTLLGLQENERKQYVLTTQRRMAEYQSMGYTIERAKELQKTFQALNKMNPKERMKQAAKQRAMMGAMGMGGEGAELFDLQTRYRTMGADEKAAAEKRMAEINAMAAKQFGSMSGSGAGMGQAMVMQTMADKTGMTQAFDTFEAESGKGRKFDQSQLGTTNEISDTSKGILRAVDFWGAAQTTAIGSLAVAIIGMGMKKGGKGIFGSIANKMAKGKGGGGGIMGMFGKSAGAASAASAATEGVTKTAGKAAAKGLGKAGIKSAIKKIPGIGLIASLGFMGGRLMDGDILGAGMELASGALGTIPGLGTAASFGVDAALAARDMGMAAEDGTTTAQPETSTQKSKYSPDSIFVELNTTLKAINEYLLTTSEANTEQAKSLNKTAKALSDNQRIFAVPDGRIGS